MPCCRRPSPSRGGRCERRCRCRAAVCLQSRRRALGFPTRPDTRACRDWRAPRARRRRPPAAGTLQTPEQFLGHRVGADNTLIRWDKIVEYLKLAAANSDRVRFRELGKTSNDNPFVALEIASADTLKNLDHFKQLEKKLYFQ